MEVKAFFDNNTSTLTYVVFDPSSRDAVVIDSVWDFNYFTGQFWTESFNKVANFIDEQKLNLHFVLETHAHADHISASQLFKQKYPHVKVAIGEHIKEVQETFKSVFNLEWLKTDGSQFDRLLKDEEEFKAGTLSLKVYNTPGHTPACLCYLIGDCLFTGDALFMPDSGTGRCDFPKGSAISLYQSIVRRIFALPENIRVFTGHDYQPGGRELKFESTLKEQKLSNVRLNGETTQEDFVQFREKRDKELEAPKLLYPSIQININAGRFPPVESNGKSYFRIPLSYK